ncbi:PREDICTED: pectinesterase inhibitor 1-like [Camelina sativa]|uniref:Pectinesterase inhibitor 1-like n=1 Tax=Camelina sativa TaxID=90675 RepID=A0ABM0Y1S2_CAMSA|nr:PREDICTED: pectinesterase inhibitor 1-like [Camelina sativa]
MVTFYNKKNSLALLVVLLFLFVSSSYAKFSMMVTKSQIDTICTIKRINSSFCFEIFKANPEIARLNYSDLIKFLINYQAQYISDTLKFFKLSGGSSTDISSKYHVCVELYEYDFKERDNSLRYLAAKDYVSLNIWVGGTMTDAETCIDDLSTMKPIPQFFMKRSDTIGDMSSIILVVLECFLKEKKDRCYLNL